MGYNQGTTIYLTANSGGLVLLNSATGGSYDPNPDAKVASITKKVTISDTVISSGGTLYVSGAGATISGAHIYDSGVLTGNKAAIFSNVVVYSGGSFWRTSTGASAVDLSAYSGAIISGWNGGAPRLFGSQWHVESGAIFRYANIDYTDVYTDENHALHNFWVSGAVHIYSSMTLADAKLRSLLYLHNGTTLLGATNVPTSGSIAVYSNCNVQNVKFDQAAGFYLCGSGTTLGGADTNISLNTNKTIFYCQDEAYNTGISDPDLKIENGVVTGMKLVSSGAWLRDITLNNGIQVNAPAISSGGTLTIGSGGIASDAVVHQSGFLLASSGGTLFAPTVLSNGGGVYVYDGATISGGVISGHNSNNMGFINAAPGAVISGAITVSRYGRMIGGDFSNEGASLNVLNSGGFGGTTLNVAKEKLFFDGEVSTDAYVENGVLHDLVLSNRVLTVADGLKFDNIAIQSGARLNVQSNTTLTDTVVSAGVCYIYGYCGFSGGTISGGSASAFSYTKISGLVISGGKLELCSNTASALGIKMYGGSFVTIGRVSGAIVSGGYIVARKGGVVSGGVFYGNNTTATADRRLYLSSGAVASNITLSGGLAYVSQGATVSGATVDSGYLWFFDPNTAVVSPGRPVISGANIIIHANGEATFRGVNARGSNVEISGGWLSVQNGALVEDITFTNGGSCAVQRNNGTGVVDSGAAVTVKDVKVVDGVVSVGLNGTVDGIDLQAGAISCYNATGAVVNARISGGVVSMKLGTLSDATVTGGEVLVSNGATVSGATVMGGQLTLSAGATGNEVTIGENGAATVAGTLNIATSAWNVAVANGGVVNVEAEEILVNANAAAGARINFTCNKTGANFAGTDTNVAEGALWYSFAGSGSEGALDPTCISGHIEGGVIKDLNADAAAIRYKLSIGDGIVVDGGILNQKFARISCFNGAKVNGTVVSAGAIICNDTTVGTMDNVTLIGAGIMNLSGTAKATNTVVENGGTFALNAATVKAENTILKAGAKFNINAEGADTGKSLTIDFTDAAVSSATINWLDRLAGSTTVYMTGVDEAGNYEIKTSGGTLDKVVCGLYEVTSGAAAYTNGIVGLTYGFDGTVLTAADAGIATAATATKLTTSGTNINSGDLAVKWDATTEYTANAFLADGLTTGNAWLDIDGFAKNTANIYGAAKNQNFTGSVNIGANSGTIKNLAAGAALGGSVAGVKLTVGKDMNVTGAVYAGGMGDVTGATETLIAGGAFAGNVFAGALCNYAANQTATATDDIVLTVNGGTFAGNIYAGAAVKAGAATTTVHTADDITVELNGGTATKGTFCVYGGGYATGTTEDAPVYEAGDVKITVAGGSWGSYLSGRGLFGGVYADKVAASVDSVAISVTGGKMGNVYGGGWAQNGGTSTVEGAVNITVAGDAQIANVFGGGSYSTNGTQGATSVGSVSITVAGGNIANNIFAGGQNEFSTVGDVSVAFTGSNDYTCNVYGYGVQTTATETTDKDLTFAGYTGTLSGNIGGFDGIAFSGDTAATLTGATIDNDDWSFDYTGRTLDAGLAMATFDNGELSGEVAVDLSDAEQAAGGWSIAAGLTAADATYSVELSTGSAANLALGDALGDAYGIYEGWGFTLEDSTLKFKQLA